MVVGILALQGGFRAHGNMLESLGIPNREIRLSSDLDGISALILPGGESSTMLKLLEREGLFEKILQLGQKGMPILGTCAGAILMCEHVIHPEQRSFGFIPATIERNAYGSQRESFETDFPVKPWGLVEVHALFIRAPRITDIGPDVEKLSTLDQDLTGITYRNFTAVTYHPELTKDPRFHQNWYQRITLAKKVGV